MTNSRALINKTTYTIINFATLFRFLFTFFNYDNVAIIISKY